MQVGKPNLEYFHLILDINKPVHNMLLYINVFTCRNSYKSSLKTHLVILGV